MRRRRLAVIFAVAVAVQLFSLYWPRVTIEGPVTWSDKVMHVLLFAIPSLLGMYAVRSPWIVVAAMVVHAPASELIQHWVLPGRSGDPFDVVADLSGVALAVACWVILTRRTTAPGQQ